MHKKWFLLYSLFIGALSAISVFSIDNAEHLVLLARNTKDLDEQKNIFEQIAHQYPASSYGHYAQGRILDMAGNSHDAAIKYIKAFNLNSRLYYAAWNAGLYYRENRNYSSAIEMLSHAIKCNPPDIRNLLVDRGMAYEFNGDLDKAMLDYTRVIETIDPKYSYAYYCRANVLRSKGQLDSAIDDYTKAISLNPTLISAHLNRGVALCTKGDTLAGIADFKQELAISSPSAMIYANLGVAFSDAGHFSEANTYLSKAIHLDNTYSKAYIYRGNNYIRQKNYFLGYFDIVRGKWYGKMMPYHSQIKTSIYISLSVTGTLMAFIIFVILGKGVLSTSIKMSAFRFLEWPLGLKLVLYWIVLASAVSFFQIIYWTIFTNEFFPSITLQGTYAIATASLCIFGILAAILFHRAIFVRINIVTAVVHLFVTLHWILQDVYSISTMLYSGFSLYIIGSKMNILLSGWNAFIFLIWAIIFMHLMRKQIIIKDDNLNTATTKSPTSTTTTGT